MAWLHFLRENGFGGILADEMGLGKTLQTLAFLRLVAADVQEALTGSIMDKGQGKVRRRRVWRRRILSAPSPPFSSAENQARYPACSAATLNRLPDEPGVQLGRRGEKFTPELKVLALHGPDRHARFDQIPASDIVVTSYALIRRDAERYRALEFDTVVLDEAQHIKNRQTQNAQAVKAVKARHRLVLTGTPLENSVLDLWSIFDFLMPGYLGTAKDFRERYELPIAKEKNAEAQTRLARRLRPFMLRRLKKDVASDLPAKLEQVSFCELTPDQRQRLSASHRSEPQGSAGSRGRARRRQKPHGGAHRVAAVAAGVLRFAAAETGEREPRQRVGQAGFVRRTAGGSD